MKGTTCAIDYRLAPQHPFPAAVEDALATYLYMIDPPKGIQPISPEKIVVSGDSAGGGLTFALLIAIRDAKLPAPAGAMTLSPWVDLTHSFPSIMTNIATDYLPPVGFKHAPSPALDYARLPYKKEDAEMLEQARAEASASVTTDTDGKLEVPVDKSDANRRISIGPFGECIPRASIDGSDVYRVQFYADNDALKIPMVSPVFDRRHLRGLPRVLVQCGTAERLRDESVYLALQASNAFSEDNENTASRDKLTNITLEMYTDQPHVFQLFFSHKCTSRAVKNLAAFVRDVTNSPASHNNSKQRKNEHQQQHQLTTKDHGCKANYLSDEKLNIWKIDPQGNMADVKEQMLKNFSREEWKEWKRRLDRPSIKERIDEVVDAFNKFAKNEPTAQDKQ
ncbi:Alpha/Beta hydrolase protein [Mycotypha africana]|uniref:Alpha/Beta hydrolase protein n=1 Tax=Mycotypha africana TaxID=64632 RepID=UPI002301A614|nr:Alpha/Beta hydrolase protein [Mycotypha africana]KAI8984464.1 Alpha/Beta hydrolase protein [Mycotypha africana]